MKKVDEKSTNGSSYFQILSFELMLRTRKELAILDKIIGLKKIGMAVSFFTNQTPPMSRKIKVYGKTNPLFGWIISHHFAALFTYFSCEEVMYLMSSFMYIYHFSLSQWLIFNQKWAKNISNLKLPKFHLFS